MVNFGSKQKDVVSIRARQQNLINRQIFKELTDISPNTDVFFKPTATNVLATNNKHELKQLNYSSSKTDRVRIVGSASMIKEPRTKNTHLIKVYPNPNDGIFRYELEKATSDLTNFASEGIYELIFESKNEIEFEKFVVQ